MNSDIVLTYVMVLACVVVLSCVMVVFSVGHCYSDSLHYSVNLFQQCRTPFTVLLCDNLVLWR